MPFQSRSFIAKLLIALILPMGAIATDLGSEAYLLPLVDAYAIHRSDQAFRGSADRDLYQLVKIAYSSPSGVGWHPLVSEVASVAVQHEIIFGTSEDGFFILDARQPKQEPQILSIRDDWETALSRFGITESSVTKAPDMLAAGLSEHVLRPWNYARMGNRFGISDDEWSLFGQLAAMGLAFIVGRFFMRSRQAIKFVSALGAFGAMIAHIMVDGQGSFMLLLFTPIMYFAAVVGRRDLRVVDRPAAGA